MQNLDKQLKISICSILNSLEEKTVDAVIEAVKYAGLESLTDLQFVQEEDLILVLKPIQRRKLVKAWSEQSFILQLSDEESDKMKQAVKEEKEDFSCMVKSVVSSDSAFDLTTDLSASAIGSCASTIESEDFSNDRTLEDFETNKEDDLKYLMKAVNENKVDPLSKVGAPPMSAFNMTVTAPGVSSANSTASYSNSQSEWSPEREKIGKSKNIIFPTKVISYSSTKKFKWNRTQDCKLLQIYAEYRTELSYPDVDEQYVWMKIAAEFKNSDALECRNRVDHLMNEYESLKDSFSPKRQMAKYLDKVRDIFEAPENTAGQSRILRLRSCEKRNKPYNLSLLKVYSKYKAELTSPDAEEQKVWKKIAREMRELYAYNCGESLCRFDIHKLNIQYISSKNIDPKNGVPYYVNEAQKAFETPRNLGKHIEKKFTLRVDNLSKRAIETDLEDLFKHFGTISGIHMDKDELGQHKDFAFISFSNRDDAIQACYAVNNHVFRNR